MKNEYLKSIFFTSLNVETMHYGDLEIPVVRLRIFCSEHDKSMIEEVE